VRRPKKLGTVDDAIIVLKEPGFQDYDYRKALDIVLRADPAQLTRAQLDELTELLERRADDPDRVIQVKSAQALARLAPDRAGQRLVERIAASDPGDYQARQALAELLEIDRDCAVAILMKRLKSSNRVDCQDAADQLSKLKHAEALPLIAERFAEDVHGMGKALLRYGPDAEGHIWPHLTDPGAAVRIAGLRLLAEIGTDRSVAKVRPLLDDSMRPVGDAAASAMRKLAPEQFDSVDQAIRQLAAVGMHDRARAVRLLAAAADAHAAIMQRWKQAQDER
jgi:hypothetical protein